MAKRNGGAGAVDDPTLVYDVLRHVFQQGNFNMPPFEQALSDFKRSRAYHQRLEEQSQQRAQAELEERRALIQDIDGIRTRFNQYGYVGGVVDTAEWRIALGFCENRARPIEEVKDAGARLHPDALVVQFWRTEKDLEEYNRKRLENEVEYKKNLELKFKESEARSRVPWSPAELRDSAVSGYEVNLQQVYRLIAEERTALLERFDSLPTTRFVTIRLYPNTSGYQPVLKVRWRKPS